MADNVTLNAGSGGDVVATEDIGGVEYQKVKLIDGTATSTTAIPLSGDLTNGLDVDVTRVSGTVTVDGSGVTQPVSGTVTANLSATDNAVLDTIDAVLDTINAKLVTGTVIGDVNLGATDNAVLDTIATNTGAAIPTGSNTIGEVTIGAATTAAGDLAKAEDAVHSSGDVGVMALGVRQDTQADFGADGDYVPFSIDADGAIRVNAINANGTSTDDAAFTAGTGTGAVLMGFATSDAVDSGDAGAVAMSTSRRLHVDANLGAATSGGTTLYKNIDVDETEDQIKATAGQVFWIHAMNLTASPLYLKFYNATAASVTVGTTVPDLTFPLPTQGDTNGAGFTLSIPNGIEFGTAITIAATTGIADNDSGAPGANAVVVNLGYA